MLNATLRLTMALLLILSTASILSTAFVQLLPGEGVIAFERGNDIYLADVARGYQIRLTNHPEGLYYWEPMFSPDGSQIAFIAGNDFEVAWGDIYLMDSNGDNLHSLTHGKIVIGPVSWSNGGESILFTPGSRAGGTFYILDVCTLEVHTLFPESIGNEVTGDWPKWSPNGEYIVFMSYATGNGDLYLVDASGTNLRRLTRDDMNTYSPSWSPDGQYIAFSSGGETRQEIYVVNVGSGEVKQLTDNGLLNMSPVWSPDSQQIAFESGDYLNRQINIMDIDGSHVHRVTDNDGYEASPTWRP